jgi:hypothetical protein
MQKRIFTKTSSNMKENVTISEADQQSSRSRGEVAAQEQIRILNQVLKMYNADVTF